MSTITPTTDLAPMTAEEFIAWAREQPELERHELHDGVVVTMPGEDCLHGEIKTLLIARLVMAMQEKGIEGQVFTSRMNVEVAPDRVFKPDVVVRIGGRLPPYDYLLKDPVIVVEVLSRPTKSRDTGIKLRGYQSLPTLHHYLLVDPEKRLVTHNRRTNDATFIKVLHGDGPLTLNPPDMTISRFFP